MLQYQEYIVEGDEICAALPFRDHYTIKYRSWPKDLDKDYLNASGKKLKRDVHEIKVKDHTSIHIEDLCIEEDQTTT